MTFVHNVKGFPGFIESFVHQVVGKPCPDTHILWSLYILQRVRMYCEQRLKMFTTIQTWEVFAVICDG